MCIRDRPYVDLTCAVLGIGDEPGEMVYFTREDCVLAGTEVVRRIMGKLGCEVVSAEPSGARVAAGGTFMTCLSYTSLRLIFVRHILKLSPRSYPPENPVMSPSSSSRWQKIASCRESLRE